jgi:methionine biosynthesis protein MetW
LAELKAVNLDYDAYWRYRAKDRLQSRYMAIANELRPGSSVLDIGCGDGTNLEYLIRRLDLQGVGIDISHEAVSMAMQKGLAAFVQDITDPDWQVTETYDYIIVSEVLEHVPCPEQVIQRIQHKFERALLVTIPNIAYYPYRLQLMRGRFPIQWGYHPGEHLRFWSVADFRQWVRNFDLELTKVIPVDGLSFLFKHLPNLFGHQVVYVLRSTRTAEDNIVDSERQT